MTRSRVSRIFGAIVVTVTLAACGDENLLGPNPGDVQFAASLNIDLSTMMQTPSGLYFSDSTVGTGLFAASGDAVTANFTLWLTDGSLIDGGVDTWVLGTLSLFGGGEEGLTGMQVGGVRVLVVPSSLGFGESGSRDGFIPPGAVLVVLLEVTAIVKPGAT
jgi:FKBP-type peptidyl-prolyl cis-trans isomerase FkpA